MIMKRIILDTNFLMIPFQFNLDIFSEIDRVCDFNYELCVFEKTIEELKHIAENQRGKDKKSAKFALDILKMKKINAIKSENKDVDELILENALGNTIIATQDIALRRKLKEKGASMIVLRQKKYLQLVETAQVS